MARRAETKSLDLPGDLCATHHNRTSVVPLAETLAQAKPDRDRVPFEQMPFAERW